MKTTRKTLLALSATALLASVAFAQVGPGTGTGALPATPQGRALDRFTAADTNKDGFVSREEAQANLPRMATRFDALDTNKDGKLSTDELNAMRNTVRGQMRNGAAQGAPGMGRQAAQGRMGGGRMGGGMMQAQGPRGAGLGTGCTAADADKDGIVTRDEAAKMGPRFQQRFDSVDTNKDGKLSTEELNAACPLRRG